MDPPQWYRVVLLPPLALTLPLAALSWWLMPQDLGRWTGFGWVAVTGLAAIGLTVFLGFGGIRSDRPFTVDESETT